MGWAVVVVAMIAVVVAYRQGRHDGVVQANRSAVAPGAWVELVRSVRYRRTDTHGPNELPIGVQGVVTDIDKWGRISLWIGSPWAAAFGWDVPQVFAISDISAFRAIPINAVPPDVRNATLTALHKWESEVAEMNAQLFPPGFLELQRLLNQG